MSSRELRVDTEAFAAEASWVAKAPDGVTRESALVQVSALHSALMLRRGTGDQYRQAMVPARGAAEGEVVVSADKLVTVLRTVSRGGMVRVTMGDDHLAIASGDRVARVRAVDLAFPQWPVFTRGKVDAAMLGPVQLARVLTSVGTDENVPALTAVSFDKGTMLSTDRFRMSAITYDTTGFEAAVPSDVLKAFSKGDSVVYAESGTCDGEADRQWVHLYGGGRDILAPVPDIQFPELRRLIPDETPVSVAVRRDDLLAAVGGDEVSFTLNADVNSVEEVMTVCSHAEDVEMEQPIKVQPVRYELDGPITVRMRSKFVIDLLRGIGSSLVMLDITQADKPVVFRDLNSDLHLVMPIKKKAS